MIGHRGAASVAPENTLEGLSAAVTAGADLVEFDVDAGLLLGHPGVAGRGAPLSLEDALGALAPTGIGIQIDLKLVGVEREVAAAVRRHGLEARTVVSSTWARSLRQLAREDPSIGRVVGYPRDRAGVARLTWPAPVVTASAAALRAVMPVRGPLLLRAAGADALALHHALVSRALVGAAHARGAAVLAWTINDPDRVASVVSLGADAIVSDDPEMVVRVLATLDLP